MSMTIHASDSLAQNSENIPPNLSDSVTVLPHAVVGMMGVAEVRQTLDDHAGQAITNLPRNFEFQATTGVR